MTIDFISVECCQTSSARRFGICDDLGDITTEAYIDDEHGANWIATIINAAQLNLNFYPVDNNISFPLIIGNDPSKCDGILEEPNENLHLIELKSRSDVQWYKKGKDQIISTLNLMENFNPSQREKVRYAHICNNLRPRAKKVRISSLEKFKDDYKVILMDAATLHIS